MKLKPIGDLGEVINAWGDLNALSVANPSSVSKNASLVLNLTYGPSEFSDPRVGIGTPNGSSLTDPRVGKGRDLGLLSVSETASVMISLILVPYL